MPIQWEIAKNTNGMQASAAGWHILIIFDNPARPGRVCVSDDLFEKGDGGVLRVKALPRGLDAAQAQAFATAFLRKVIVARQAADAEALLVWEMLESS